ncbi:MAG: LamG-like jellyroll fold domain-containing protein [bacterium]
MNKKIWGVLWIIPLVFLSLVFLAGCPEDLRNFTSFEENEETESPIVPYEDVVLDLSFNRPTQAATVSRGIKVAATDPNDEVVDAPLNDGTAVDISPNGNDGVINGAAFVPGRYGTGLSFDGVDDYVEVADSPSLDITTNLSVEAWIKLNSIGGNQRILRKGEGTPNTGYAMRVEGNVIRYFFYDSTNALRSMFGTTTLSTGTWYHVAMTYDGTTLRGYINGNLDNSITPPGGTTIGTNNLPLTIGGDSLKTYQFNGVIDEVKVTRVAKKYVPSSATVVTVGTIPPTATLSAGDVQPFVAEAYDASGNVIVGASPTWSVSGTLNPGDLDPTSGLFTATLAGSGQVKATIVDKVGASAVTVNPGPLSTINVSPYTATIPVGGVQQFTASGTDAYGNPVAIAGPIAWSQTVDVINSTIDSTGLFSAGTAPDPSSGNVIAKDNATGITGSSGTITVTGSSSPTNNPPVAYYSFDEGSGGVAGSLINSIDDGNVSGATWVAGKSGSYGSALSFNGTSDYVEIPYNASSALNISGNGITMEAWIYPTSTSWSRIILNKENSYEIAVNSGVFQAAVETTAAGGWFWAGTGSVPINQWTHVAATYDAGPGKIKTYINGVLQDSTNVTGKGTVVTNTNPLRIGRRASGSYFAGMIDSVSISDYAKSYSNSGPVSYIDVYPPSTTLDQGSKRQFLATGYNASNGVIYNFVPTWSVLGSIGTIDAAGIFSATSAGTGSVVATDTSSGASKSSNPVTVNPIALPKVSSTTPTNGATDVSITSTIVAKFDRDIDPSTLPTAVGTTGAESFVLYNNTDGAYIAGNVTYNPGTREAIFTPSSNLSNGKTYTAKVKGSVADTGGKTLDGNNNGAAEGTPTDDYTWTFTTVALPRVVAVSPGSGAVNVPLTTVITATFNKSINPATLPTAVGTTGAESFVLYNSTDGVYVAGNVGYNAGTKTATFTPSVNLLNSKTYIATVKGSVSDTLGNTLDGDNDNVAEGVPNDNYIWSFQTVGALPKVSSVVPANGASGVAISTVIAATFTRDIDSSTLPTVVGTTGSESFTLYNSTDGSYVAGSVSYQASTKTATFTPSGGLLNSKTYAARLRGSIADTVGSTLDGNNNDVAEGTPADDYTWSFTTASDGGGGGGGPAGTVLYYDPAGASGPGLYKKNADGSGTPTLIVLTGATANNLKWSPDGSKVVWDEEPSANNYEIYVRNSDGSGVTVNVSVSANSARGPSWAPDSIWIAWYGFDGADANYDIFIQKYNDPASQQQLTVSPATKNMKSPAWSPLGNKIAYCGWDGSDYEIYVISDGDGNWETTGDRTTTQVTNNSVNEADPQWSPDGSKLVYQSYVSSGNWEIYTANADGTGTPTRFTNNSVNDFSPRWSPDGSKIAWVGSDGDPEIYVKNSDNSGSAMNVTNNSSAETSVVWSADSSSVLYYRQDDGKIYAKAADGSGSETYVCDGKFPTVR